MLEEAVDLAPRAVGARTVVDIIFRGDAPHVQPIAAHADLLEEGASDLEPRAVCARTVEDLFL